MSRTRIKQLLGLLVMAGTLAFLVYYWQAHPEISQQLRAVSPWSAAAVIGLYFVMSLVLVWIYDAILRLVSKPIPLGEHTLLTLYSSIINFFGPLQSGPGFRTLYLKQRHGVPIGGYVAGTLLYYLLFGLINLMFLAAGVLAVWLWPLLAAGGLGVVWLLRRYADALPFLKRLQAGLHSPLLARIAGFTLLQALLVVVIYAIELQAIGHSASLREVVAYAGAGSLALFVSLTPAAIGFRESFQFFSQSIHGVDNAAIVAANLLDRSAYVAFLGLAFLAIVGLHARRRLQLPNAGGSDR